MHIYIYITLHYVYYRLLLRRLGVGWRERLAQIGWHYLSNATCLIQASLAVCAVYSVEDRYNLQKCSPCLKKTCVRQVVLRSRSPWTDGAPSPQTWGNTNRVVSNRVVSKGPLYPSKTKIIIFCVFWYDPVYMPLTDIGIPHYHPSGPLHFQLHMQKRWSEWQEVASSNSSLMAVELYLS